MNAGSKRTLPVESPLKEESLGCEVEFPGGSAQVQVPSVTYLHSYAVFGDAPHFISYLCNPSFKMTPLFVISYDKLRSQYFFHFSLPINFWGNSQT